MIQMTINGKQVEATKGQSILEVCRQNRIPVPTLCHHEAVEDYGGCRLCVVEVGHPDWGGWTGVMTSCLYPAKEGLTIQTNSPRVREVRKTVLDLLLAQAPKAKPVLAFAKSLGLSESSYPVRDPENLCILCGLCVRVCAKIGTNAITTQGRGAGKYIGTPFDLEPDACIGCLSCAHVCPTGHITFEDDGRSRSIWSRTFEVLRCSQCGKPLVTAEQRDWMVEHDGLSADYVDRCETCKRTEIAAQFAGVGR
jgi:NADH dehydrogenase/NADH:ubiquinone oxidoreductase subunit G